MRMAAPTFKHVGYMVGSIGRRRLRDREGDIHQNAGRAAFQSVRRPPCNPNGPPENTF